jgi:glycosyltransferase involved in cell wall biosynthesis
MLAPLQRAGVSTHVICVGAKAYGEERRIVARLMQELNADILHTHGYRPAVLHGSAARRLGIAAVATSHGFIGGGWKNRVYEYLMRRAFRSYDAVVAVSQPMFDFLRDAGVPADRLHCTPNAWSEGLPFVDRAAARDRLGIPHDAACAGFAGRVSHEKGMDVLLDALTRMASPPLLAVIGDGPLRTGLEQAAHDRGIAGHVRWCGAVPNAGTLMKAFDVFVLSSRTEGTPMVLLEAIAAGVPVVATAVGGIPDVVSSDEALLVPSEDPGSLADAVAHSLSDREAAAARAARAAKRLAEEYGAAEWVSRYDAVYAGARRRRTRTVQQLAGSDSD